jgi:hypothetical protein
MSKPKYDPTDRVSMQKHIYALEKKLGIEPDTVHIFNGHEDIPPSVKTVIVHMSPPAGVEFAGNGIGFWGGSTKFHLTLKKGFELGLVVKFVGDH